MEESHPLFFYGSSLYAVDATARKTKWDWLECRHYDEPISESHLNSRIYPHPFFAKEGWPILIGVAAVTILLSVLGFSFLAALGTIVFIFCAQFFRDPARELPADPRAVVSPVDGRVCKVQKAADPLTGAECTMVSIFMNVFNVHSQKAPLAGTVEEIVYTPGLFVNADLDKASTDNERNAVRVLTPEGKSVTFVQVAGLVARRILCYAKVGQKLERGERYGFIRFGSRVDVYLPPEAEITVSIGDKVTGVMSTIARL